MGVVKTSVLLLYYELFPSDNFRLYIRYLMAFVGAMTLACALGFMFQCTPVRSFWILELWPTKHCVNGAALSTASSALSLVTDLVILVLPVKYLIGKPVFVRKTHPYISNVGS